MAQPIGNSRRKKYRKDTGACKNKNTVEQIPEKMFMSDNPYIALQYQGPGEAKGIPQNIRPGSERIVKQIHYNQNIENTVHKHKKPDNANR
jgi:hypothetical protein